MANMSPSAIKAWTAVVKDDTVPSSESNTRIDRWLLETEIELGLVRLWREMKGDKWGPEIERERYGKKFGISS